MVSANLRSVVGCGNNTAHPQETFSNLPMSHLLKVLALSVIAVGLILRLLLAAHPLLLDTDEVAIVDHALRMFNEGPNPRYFIYPTLFMYLVAFSEGILFGMCWLLGITPSPASFADWYFTDPRYVYWTARLWSIAAGSGTLVLVYYLGRRLWSSQAGLWAAAFLAASPTHIYYSAIAKTDAAMVFAMQLALLLAVRYHLERRFGLLVGSAALSGCSASLKYPGGVALFAAAVALLLNSASRGRSLGLRLMDLVVIGVVATAVFFAGSPFVLLDLEKFRLDMTVHLHIGTHRLPGTEGEMVWALYLWRYLPDALSFPILGLAAWGAVCMFRQAWKTMVILLLPLTVYLIPLFLAEYAREGYLLPLLPTLCVWAGIGLEQCRVEVSGTLRFQPVFQGGLALLCVSSSLYAAICSQIRVTRGTTPEKTSGWIREHLPPGSRIFGTATGMRLPLTDERLAQLVAEATKDRQDGGARMRFLQRTSSNGTGYGFYDMDKYLLTSRTVELRQLELNPEWIMMKGFQYVVVREESLRWILMAPDRHPVPMQFLKWVEDHGKLLFTTHPGSHGYADWKGEPAPARALEPRCGLMGGELRVYQIKDGS